MTIQVPEAAQRWGLFEAALSLGDAGIENPFVDVSLNAEFTAPDGSILSARGFYAGGGVWKVRYMPGALGRHTFRLSSDHPGFTGSEGSFECVLNAASSHGPVRIRGDRFHYADQTPAFICGTTLYAWWYRPEEVCRETLSEIQKIGFNKVRMLVFPKYLAGFVDFELTHQPPCLPFEKKGDHFDFSRPVPAYFDLLEKRVAQLDEIGVEADIILFHNYDFGMWGIDEQLTDEMAEGYLDYLTARLGAYKNVWWSLANEYDIWKNPDGSGCIYKLDRRNWDALGRYIQRIDPYGKPRSIHNCGPLYPDTDWLTHVSVQFPNTYSLLLDLKQRYSGKPVINDEYQYEGNLIDSWGNLSGEQETLRHWLSAMACCYATHGECFVADGNRRDIFWTYGGKLRGTSAARIGYLKRLVGGLPFERMQPDHALGNGIDKFCIRDERREFFFLYTPACTKRDRTIGLGLQDGKKRRYQVTVYDLWKMETARTFVLVQGSHENPRRDAQGNPLPDPLEIREQGLIGVRFEQIREL